MYTMSWGWTRKKAFGPLAAGFVPIWATTEAIGSRLLRGAAVAFSVAGGGGLWSGADGLALGLALGEVAPDRAGFLVLAMTMVDNWG
jgi:hypothetical protein